MVVLMQPRRHNRMAEPHVYDDMWISQNTGVVTTVAERMR